MEMWNKVQERGDKNILIKWQKMDYTCGPAPTELEQEAYCKFQANLYYIRLSQKMNNMTKNWLNYACVLMFPELKLKQRTAMFDECWRCYMVYLNCSQENI